MRFSPLTLGLMAALYLGTSVAEDQAERPLLQVDRFSVTVSEVASRIAELAEQLDLKGPPPPDNVRTLAREILKSKAMAAEAEARQLQQAPAVQARLESARRQVLRDALVETIEAQIQVPDMEGAARDYYDSHPDKFRSPPRVKLSHILFTDDPNAPAEGVSGLRQRAESSYQAILARLEAGESFAALAKEFSQDRGTAARGGALGDWTTGEKLDRRFAAAALALEPGQVSELVETRYGFHVIRMDDRVPEAILPYESVKLELLNRFQEEHRQRELAKALKAYDELAESAEWDEGAVAHLSQSGIPAQPRGVRDSQAPGDGKQ